MRAYTFTEVSDTVLLSGLAVSVAQERGTTAVCLAQLAEVEARRLYAPAGYPSMSEYCVDELHLSESSTWKRLQAARAARRIPALLIAVEEGRLHLAAVCLLAPKLTRENAAELIEMATHRRKSEVERLLAERFPRTELLPLVKTMSATQSAPVAAGPDTTPKHADSPAPGQVGPTEQHSQRTRMAPLAAERFEFHLSVGKRFHDKLCHAQDLLSHAIPSGDVEQVLERALDSLIGKLEKRKFGTTSTPRSTPRATINKRHIPAHIRRAVRERDRNQCTFVSENGHRCSAKKFLELDHIVPVARGGRATVDGIRLDPPFGWVPRRAHNQFEAERTYGAGFMDEKRQAARIGRNVVET